MAKLPATIYNEIQQEQRKLFENGERNGTMTLEAVYYYFDRAGYRRTTANKWLLNWAVCKMLRFEKNNKEGRLVRLGYFPDLTDIECLDGAWLPVKEVKSTNGARADRCIL